MIKDLPIASIRFKSIRQEQKLTQQTFAECLGISGTTADIERGKTKISGEIVTKLFQLYRINPLWLFGESNEKYLHPSDNTLPKVVTLNSEEQENVMMVPVKASAGYAHNLQDVEWYENLPAFDLPLPEYRNATHRAFQVKGDSMHPVLHQGEWVIARATERLSDIKPDNLYVVVLPDTVVVKKMIVTNEHTQLISINKEYPPIECPTSEIQEVWQVVSKITTNFEVPEYTYDKLAQEMKAGFEAIKSRL
ncbi:Phage repressor protein C, contains Cro/C1-type HTH and peptisase s24 domains [Zhouia amylolytica]|uniref:HTH cro/C1-type domain-containing protein n=2 Tax=Zhouia amylolytica TaxID=376730 RepID=W2US17_9FLAO|nr:LexA family transcriptional regulator [Zhouia amylolytica]ETN96251.1 hypothetical protein P278_07620 [Zhouia amylolytica AD3]MCQ0112624.1 helix-turn-helix domain-containing protein [Zhouia amylolytica]SFS85850.1 Phage repressor protein C, contains Cro/C1-type HTH and peptisase s24 domains [Zhouia amylolytica]